MNIFDTVENNFKPLAERMRPKTLEDFIGQDDTIGKGTPLRNMIENDLISSMILYGPPGVGKTTLAKIISEKTNAAFIELSATTSGIKDIKEAIEKSKYNKLNNKKTILFVDEIHRFNKLQQDTFLPYIENGDIILLGATTENPSFEVNTALLSRVKVYRLKGLNIDNIKKILERALKDSIIESLNVEIDEESINYIAITSQEDARTALNTLENIVNGAKVVDGKRIINIKILEELLKTKSFIYDKNGEEHYNLISAFQKSIRSSSPQAAIYYLARMLEAGEDPMYVVRRLVRIASEDIGLANPNALPQAVAAKDALELLGMPEANTALSQATIYLAISPKSNRLETAYIKAADDARNTYHIKVPMHLRNAITSFDKENGVGVGYKYAHDYKYGITDLECMPQELIGKIYYEPTNNGNEKKIKETLESINRYKEELKKESN